ncbi:MAG: hypothetical protein AAF682_13365 [Planctomycetota bacterium]
MTRSLRRPLTALLLGLVLTSPPAAQDRMAAAAALPALPAPSGPSAPAFAANGDGLFAAGPGYTAGLGPDGFRLRELAGGSELHLALELAGRGAEPWRPPSTVLAPEHGAEGRAVFRHGAVEERYAARPDGVELSFLLHTLPAGDGELVLRVRTATALRAEPGSYGAAGLAFGDGATTHLVVGGVTAIDADGRRAEGRLAWDGEALELRVPSVFVDRATLPLLVDPLIQPEVLVEETATAPDAAFDATHGVYLVVFDHGVLGGGIAGRRFDAAGNALGPTFPIAPGSETTRPRVASINASDRFLVVYGRFVAGQFLLEARAVDADDGEVSDAVVLYQSTTSGALYPDVGGDPVPPFDEGLVVWQTEQQQIVGQLVTCPATGIPTPAGGLVTLGSHGIPVVTDSNGPSGHWLVVWSFFYDFPPPGDYDVLGLLVDYTGAACGTSTTLLGVVGEDERASTVAGDGDTFAVLGGHEVGGSTIAEAVCASRTGCTLTPGAPKTVHAAPPVAATMDIALVDGAFLASWFTSDREILTRRLGLPDCEPCGASVVASTNADYVGGFPPPIESASRYTADFGTGAEDDVLVVWQRDSTPREVRATIVEAWGGGAVTDLGAPCGAGTLSLAGAPVPGNADFGLKLEGAPFYSGLAFLLLTSSDVTYPLGGCTLIDPTIAIGTQVSVPDSFFPVPLGCEPGASGVTWRVQYVLSGIEDAPIPGVPGVGFSNTVEFVFGD